MRARQALHHEQDQHKGPAPAAYNGLRGGGPLFEVKRGSDVYEALDISAPPLPAVEGFFIKDTVQPESACGGEAGGKGRYDIRGGRARGYKTPLRGGEAWLWQALDGETRGEGQAFSRWGWTLLARTLGPIG